MSLLARLSLANRGLVALVAMVVTAFGAFAVEHALARGIIIGDTKFEFGLDEHGTLHLMEHGVRAGDAVTRARELGLIPQ